MKIAYIWIEKYDCIENQGFNFGDKYIFDYDHANNKLTHKENPDYIKDFYNEEKNGVKINVTSIIGKNGAGKSTLLRYILKNVKNRVNKTKDFAIFRLHEDYIIYYNKQETTINNPIVKFYQDFNFNLAFPSFIYYSNDFMHNEVNYLPDIINLSSSYLFENDSVKSKLGENTTHIFKHKIIENKKQIDFIRMIRQDKQLEQLFTVTKVPIPDKIDISAIEHQFSKEEKEIIKNSALLKEVEQSHADLTELYEKDSAKNSTNYCRSKLCFYGYTSIIKILIRNDLGMFLDVNYTGTDTFEKIISFCTNIKPRLEQEKEKERIEHENRENKMIVKYDWRIENCIAVIDKTVGFIDFFERELLQLSAEQHKTIKEKYRNQLLSLNFVDKNSAEYNLFENFYNNYRELENLLVFDFHNLSSGEGALLGIFSRFYAAKREINEASGFLVILLDEPDLYFHPEWQRCLLSYLCTFFKNKSMFGDKCSIHFVIASNSPFITADVPLTNVIFLGEDKDKAANHTQTFASNIHTLFKDDFYMTSSFGAIAEQKIKQIFEKLNQSEVISADEYKSLSKLINVIGEPVLKRKLQQLLEEKLSNELLIKSYEEKIQELKSRQKK